MILSEFGADGTIKPLLGELNIEARGTSFCVPGGKIPRVLQMHRDDPPTIQFVNGSAKLVDPHVLVKGRNFLIVGRDHVGNTSDVLLAFTLPLPKRELIKGKKPVEVYSRSGAILTQRIFRDSAKSMECPTGRKFTLFGFTLLRRNESARLISDNDTRGKGKWILYNNEGDIQVSWSDGISD